MANGESYHAANPAVAACPDWVPLGTRLTLYRRDSGPNWHHVDEEKQEAFLSNRVEVVCSDRGRFGEGAIDLSEAAFDRLGLRGEGVIHVAAVAREGQF